MSRLQVILTSTRPNRRGHPVAHWFIDRAKAHAGFEHVELVDLMEVGLPMLDEPEHPRLRKYHHEHTQRWSKQVLAADAYVFVLPEYNHGMPPALVNALNYVYHEWTYKPAGIVSYGGVCAGARSANTLVQTLVTLRIMPIPETVAIPFIDKNIDSAGKFTGQETQNPAVPPMLDELLRWSKALQPLRPQNK